MLSDSVPLIKPETKQEKLKTRMKIISNIEIAIANCDSRSADLKRRLLAEKKLIRRYANELELSIQKNQLSVSAEKDVVVLLDQAKEYLSVPTSSKYDDVMYGAYDRSNDAQEKEIDDTINDQDEILNDMENGTKYNHSKKNTQMKKCIRGALACYIFYAFVAIAVFIFFLFFY